MEQSAALHNGMSSESQVNISLQSESDPNNFYATLVQNQNTAIISHFTLESGIALHSFPVAYSTWGTLNQSRDNVLILCHALTGSSDALDWWRPLMGPGKALDYTRYLIFCANVLGSPYGSASPLSTNHSTGRSYGPEFPQTTIRDDVLIHKLILDALSVRNVAAVIGGSMGGMTALEWSLCTPPGYLRNIIPITTSAYHGAWGISWGETQRQAIYADTAFKDGWYNPTPEGQPRQGLGTARMIAMLTYRSHGSFEKRFSRMPAATVTKVVGADALPTPPPSHRGSMSSEAGNGADEKKEQSSLIQFAAQSYLHYQASKFLRRFDANCYIHLTKKMDTHDVTRGRLPPSPSSGLDCELSYPLSKAALRSVFSTVPPKSLVISVETDVLFRPEQQIELSNCLPEAKFVTLESSDGHDGFLLEFETLNRVIKAHLKELFPLIYTGDTCTADESVQKEDNTLNSVFGEAENVVF